MKVANDENVCFFYHDRKREPRGLPLVYSFVCSQKGLTCDRTAPQERASTSFFYILHFAFGQCKPLPNKYVQGFTKIRTYSIKGLWF